MGTRGRGIGSNKRHTFESDIEIPGRRIDTIHASGRLESRAFHKVEQRTGYLEAIVGRYELGVEDTVLLGLAIGIPLRWMAISNPRVEGSGQGRR